MTQSFIPDQIANELLSWAQAHSWYSKFLPKLKPVHHDYIRRILRGMNDLNSRDMNLAWAALPDAEKGSSRQHTMAIELLGAFCSYKSREQRV